VISSIDDNAMQDSKTSVTAKLPAVALILDPLYKLGKGSTLIGTTMSNNKGKPAFHYQLRPGTF
jgi:hypothetical protein